MAGVVNSCRGALAGSRPWRAFARYGSSTLLGQGPPAAPAPCGAWRLLAPRQGMTTVAYAPPTSGGRAARRPEALTPPYNAVLSAHARLASSEGAARVYDRMKQENVAGDNLTFTLLLLSRLQNNAALQLACGPVLEDWKASTNARGIWDLRPADSLRILIAHGVDCGNSVAEIIELLEGEVQKKTIAVEEYVVLCEGMITEMLSRDMVEEAAQTHSALLRHMDIVIPMAGVLYPLLVACVEKNLLAEAMSVHSTILRNQDKVKISFTDRLNLVERIVLHRRWAALPLLDIVDDLNANMTVNMNRALLVTISRTETLATDRRHFDFVLNLYQTGCMTGGARRRMIRGLPQEFFVAMVAASLGHHTVHVASSLMNDLSTEGRDMGEIQSEVRIKYPHLASALDLCVAHNQKAQGEGGQEVTVEGGQKGGGQALIN